MTNPWLIHVDEYRKQHPSMPYKEVLKNAKLTYVKGSKQTGKGFNFGFLNPVAWVNAVKIMAQPTPDPETYARQQKQLLKTLTGLGGGKGKGIGTKVQAFVKSNPTLIKTALSETKKVIDDPKKVKSILDSLNKLIGKSI